MIFLLHFQSAEMAREGIQRHAAQPAVEAETQQVLACAAGSTENVLPLERAGIVVEEARLPS
jgi:L-fucose mutarotase/ribose pyranase (RbsD/FucU family)